MLFAFGRQLALEPFAGRRGGKTAERRFAELDRHTPPDLAHRVDDLIDGDAALNARERHIRRAHGVDRADDVALDARHLHKPRDRIADKPKQVCKRDGVRIRALLRRAAEDMRQRGGGHGAGRADLRLTAALRPGNARAQRRDLTEARRDVQRLQDRLRRKYGSPDYYKLNEVMRGTFVKVVNQDLLPLLPSIAAPTLLIWGSDDTETPLWMGQQMEKQIPDAALIVFEGRSHFAFIEEWQRFLLIIKEFFLGGSK